MKYFLIAILSATISTPAFSQATGYIETFHQIKPGEYESQVNVWLQGPVKGKVGYFAWALTGKVWSEGYAGLNYTLAKGVEIGVGAGVETDKSPARLGTYLCTIRGKFTGIAIYENGGSGYWDRVTANYTVYQHEWFKVGLGTMHQAYQGYGPRYEISIGKRITVWGSVLGQRDNKPATMLALQWNL